MELFSPPILWFVIGLVCLLLEFILPGIVIVFFGIGAWIVALLLLLLPMPIEYQLLIFISSSLFLLMALRRNLQKWFFKENADDLLTMQEYVGEKAIVVEAIAGKMPGKVELHGTRWEAEAECEIAVGTPVIVRGKKNLTLLVEPL
ncbi:MAG TPA: NfeD family protein [bacterium]|nr:NfeD family protein [bacterium]HNT67116.1 NfeD family protein [bacterium]HOX86727.1 NfeD family protein [bacterium]HPG46084.1 NfeD family protein [bacterium]HPM98289.1 NfeD family protein [bacterium]